MSPESLFSLSHGTLHNTLGAILLGAVSASILFGITTVQTYSYYHYFQGDTRLHKWAVAVLWTLDAFHLALVVQAVYAYTVMGFGDADYLHQILWSLKAQVSVNVAVMAIVHGLYALRVWILGGYHHGFLRYLVGFFVFAGLGIGVALAYEVYTISTFPELQSISWAINAGLATSTTIDFIIAIAMCYYLSKSKGTVTRLNSRISTVIQFSLSTGLLTAACSLATMFSYILLPNTFIFLALEFLLTKLYVGSFLAMLNARERKRPSSSSMGSNSHLPSWQRPMKFNGTSTMWSPSSPSVQFSQLMASPPQRSINLPPIRTSYHSA